MATESTISFFSGNHVLLKFTVDDEDNPPAVKNLTGVSEIVFAIARAEGSEAVLSVSLTANPGQVVVNADPTTGKFNVLLTNSDTEPLTDKHQYFECRVTDGAGQVATVAYGTASIKKNTITA